MREYVIAGGEIVAIRGLSQFAEAVKADEVIGSDAVKIDSDRIARIAQQYAKANGANAVSLNYQLKRDAVGSAPAWTVTCVDPAGKRLGELVFEAGKGAVLSHAGFSLEPPSDKARLAGSEERPRDRETELAPATPRRIPTRNPPPRAEFVRPPPEDNSPVRKLGDSLQRLFGGGR